MNRRDFLKIVGITTATSTAALYGCGSKEGSSEGSKVLGPIPTDKMTYRSFPGLGSDKVSILGYGCMRWPTVPAPDGKGEMIDQDAVNELVDYAIAHGVNYFDTSPMYVQGWSEHAVVELKKLRFGGFPAWAVWLFIHLMSIVGVKNRLFIFVDWMWSYFTYDPSLRIIIKPLKRE